MTDTQFREKEEMKRKERLWFLWFMREFDRFFFFSQQTHSGKSQKPNYVWEVFNVCHYTAGVAFLPLVSAAHCGFQLQPCDAYQCLYTETRSPALRFDKWATVRRLFSVQQLNERGEKRMTVGPLQSELTASSVWEVRGLQAGGEVIYGSRKFHFQTWFSINDKKC